MIMVVTICSNHDDVIKWKHFQRYQRYLWLLATGYWPLPSVTDHRSPVNSPHKGQWRGAFIFSLVCTWINGWINNREAGDLRRHDENVRNIRDGNHRCFSSERLVLRNSDVSLLSVKNCWTNTRNTGDRETKWHSCDVIVTSFSPCEVAMQFKEIYTIHSMEYLPNPCVT